MVGRAVAAEATAAREHPTVRQERGDAVIGPRYGFRRKNREPELTRRPPALGDACALLRLEGRRYSYDSRARGSLCAIDQR